MIKNNVYLDGFKLTKSTDMQYLIVAMFDKANFLPGNISRGELCLTNYKKMWTAGRDIRNFPGRRAREKGVARTVVE